MYRSVANFSFIAIMLFVSELEGFLGVEFFDAKRKTVPSHEWNGSTFGAAKKPADDSLPIKFIKRFQLDSTTKRGGIRLVKADATEKIAIPFSTKIAIP